MTHHNIQGHALCGIAKARWDTWTTDPVHVTCPKCQELWTTGQAEGELRAKTTWLLTETTASTCLAKAIDRKLEAIEALASFRLRGTDPSRVDYLGRSLRHIPRILVELSDLLAELKTTQPSNPNT